MARVEDAGIGTITRPQERPNGNAPALARGGLGRAHAPGTPAQRTVTNLRDRLSYLWLGLALAFLTSHHSLVTNPRGFDRPESTGAAWAQVQDWLGCEPAWIPQPGERHTALLGEMLDIPGMHGNLIPDAHLAVLAIEHGLTLCSTDSDFARFPRVRWTNPLSR